MKAFAHDLSPALHIAAAKVIELSSGTSFAQFLMVFHIYLFINLMASCDGLEKRYFLLEFCRFFYSNSLDSNP